MPSPSTKRKIKSVRRASQGQYQNWRLERARRQAALDQYNADHADEYASFKNAALGTSGIPMIMLRLFPELFPEIWGAPSLHFAPVGLGEDTLEPSRVLPLGLGYAPSEPAIQTPTGPVNINVVQLTCAGCHTGRVIDDRRQRPAPHRRAEHSVHALPRLGVSRR